MELLHTISLYVMAAFYAFAGYSHFKNPRFFYKITPPALKKWKEPINVIVGIAELVGAIGLIIPATRTYAAVGIIALLVAVFPANLYHLQSRGAGMKVPMWGLWLRIPIQFLLIWWAWSFVGAPIR